MAHGNWTKNTVAQVTVLGTTLGQRIVNTFHYEASGAAETGFGGSDAQRLIAQAALADDWVTNFRTEYLAMLPSAYAMQMIRAQVIEVPGQRNHKLTPTEKTSGVAGGGTGGAAPVDDTSGAGVIKWRSAQAGKQHRGRSYIGPLVGTNVEGGMLLAGGITVLQAFATKMRAWYVTTVAPTHAWNLTIYSKPYDYKEYGYPQGKNPNRVWYYPPDYDGDSSNVILDAVDPVMRSQRRRQIGVGV